MSFSVYQIATFSDAKVMLPTSFSAEASNKALSLSAEILQSAAASPVETSARLAGAACPPVTDVRD